MDTERYLRASHQAAELGLPHPLDALDIERRRTSVDRADSDRLLDSMSHMECRDIVPSMLAPLKICMLTGIPVRK